MSKIEEETVASNNDEDCDIIQENNHPRNGDPWVIESLDIILGKRNLYDVLSDITLEELNSDDVEVGRGLLTLQLVGIKAAVDHSSVKGTQGQYNYKLKNRTNK